MDRDRLKEVHQTDLTEGRVNEAFVDWLKEKGLSWLLVILVAVAVYLGITRYKIHQVRRQSEAWRAFFEARLPDSYVGVADDFANVGKMAIIARLQAADVLLNSIQRGAKLGADIKANNDGRQPLQSPIAPEDRITPEDRKVYIKRADQLYDEVIAADTNEEGLTLLMVNAMCGKAAIAECREDAKGAEEWYAKAAQRAESFYPGLAEEARSRSASEDELGRPEPFLTQAQLGALRNKPSAKTPITIEDSLKDLLLPEGTGG